MMGVKKQRGDGDSASHSLPASTIVSAKSSHGSNGSSSSSGACGTSSMTGSSPAERHMDGRPHSRELYNSERREQSFKDLRGRKRGIVDIDGPQFLTPGYDPSYGWSIWMQQRKAELCLDDVTGAWGSQGAAAPTVTAAAKTDIPFCVRQPELDETMRCALLEWLAEVSLEYKMQTSTYFLAVRLLDRVLLQLPIKKTKFQLLGCACLMIAGKLEEIESPTTDNLVVLSDNSFDVESLVVMEHTVLKMLDFKISVNTSYYFGTRLAFAAQMTDKETSFMFYMLEIALYDFSLSRELISMVAAAAAHVTIQALRAMDAPLWTAALEHYSGGHSDSDPRVREIILRITQMHWNLESSPYCNLAKRFSKGSKHKVALTGALRADNVRYTVRSRREEEGVEMRALGGGEVFPIPAFPSGICQVLGAPLRQPLPCQEHISILPSDDSDRDILLADSNHLDTSDDCSIEDTAVANSTDEADRDAVATSSSRPIPVSSGSADVGSSSGSLHPTAGCESDSTGSDDEVALQFMCCEVDPIDLRAGGDSQEEGSSIGVSGGVCHLVEASATKPPGNKDHSALHGASHTIPATIEKYWHSPSSSLFTDLNLTGTKEDGRFSLTHMDLALELEGSCPLVTLCMDPVELSKATTKTVSGGGKGKGFKGEVDKVERVEKVEKEVEKVEKEVEKVKLTTTRRASTRSCK